MSNVLLAVMKWKAGWGVGGIAPNAVQQNIMSIATEHGSFMYLNSCAGKILKKSRRKQSEILLPVPGEWKKMNIIMILLVIMNIPGIGKEILMIAQ